MLTGYQQAGGRNMMIYTKTFRLVTTVAVLVWCAATPAYASELLLKCRTHNGVELSDLVVDIQSMRAKWHSFDFIISSVTDNFIVGRSTDGQLSQGIETWVIDRRSGQFIQSRVGNGCISASMTNCQLSGNIYKGTCRKPIL